METIKEALIKEVTGIDRVFVVENLPKHFLFHKVPKLVNVPRYAVDYDRTEPKQVEAYVLRDPEAPDEPRNRRVTGEMVDELLPGIERSMTGDGGFVFFTDMNEGKDRLLAIDNYLRQTLGAMATIPARVAYAAQVGSFTSMPKPLHLIPRVVLPVPVSPPLANANVQAPSTTEAISKPTAVPPANSSAPKRRQWTDEQRKAAGERFRAANAARKAAKEAAAKG